MFLPGKSHELRSLVGSSPKGHEESDTTEQLSASTSELTESDQVCAGLARQLLQDRRIGQLEILVEAVIIKSYIGKEIKIGMLGRD